MGAGRSTVCLPRRQTKVTNCEGISANEIVIGPSDFGPVKKVCGACRSSTAMKMARRGRSTAGRRHQGQPQDQDEPEENG